jgi:CBS domain-containing protein
VLQYLVVHRKSPKETLVSEVMTKEAEMITWQTTVEEAIRAMAVHRFI